MKVLTILSTFTLLIFAQDEKTSLILEKLAVLQEEAQERDIIIDKLINEAFNRDLIIKNLKDELATTSLDIQRIDPVVRNNTFAIGVLQSTGVHTGDISDIWYDIRKNSNAITTNIDAINNNYLNIKNNTANISSNTDSIAQIIDDDDNHNNETCINNFISGTDEYCGDGPTLRKLPLWGKDVSIDDINFEWPTQTILNEMSPDVHLASIEFETDNFMIYSVKINLSEGSSPLFVNEEPAEDRPITHFDEVLFDQDVQIRSVEGCDGSIGVCYVISFYNESGVLVEEYSPTNMYTNHQREYEIQAHEELIGVYGVKDEVNWLSTFGFIVKVNQIP